jgi:hypothetical protein
VRGQGDIAIGFVVDLSDKFLDQVFEGDDAVNGSMVVDDDRQLFPVSLNRRSASATRRESGSR